MSCGVMSAVRSSAARLKQARLLRAQHKARCAAAMAAHRRVFKSQSGSPPPSGRPQRSPQPLEGVVGLQAGGREEDGLRDGAAGVAARADKAVDQAACMHRRGTPLSTAVPWNEDVKGVPRWGKHGSVAEQAQLRVDAKALWACRHAAAAQERATAGPHVRAG